MFRIRGATQPTPTNDTPQLRYVLIFRLNRTPRFARGAFLPGGASSALGNYRIENLNYVYDYPIFAFDPVDAQGHVDRSRDDCFLGDVRMRPLTPKPNGKPKYGRALQLHPRMRTMRVTPVGPVHFNQVTSPKALSDLRRIGCSATILDYAT